MIATLNGFIKEAKDEMTNTVQRDRIHSQVTKYQQSFRQGLRQFANLELAKMRAAKLRWRTINNLDKYLIEFESNFIKAGGKVIWAQDNNDVSREIINILRRSNALNVLSNTATLNDELALNAALSTENLHITETDRTEIKNNDDLSSVASTIRRDLREEFKKADAGITTALFFAAEQGSIILSDNEGASLLTSGIPRISIILAPIDCVIPAITDIDLLLPLYSTFSGGRPVPAYHTIISGTKQLADVDGPEELYIILIDNGRTNIIAHEPQRQVLSCINCGACLPASAIYKTTGGKTYPGPAKAVSIPLASGSDKFNYLADLTTMDGSGSEACPVKINFPRLVLQNRKYFVDNNFNSRQEKWFYFAWKKAMLKRDIISWTGINARKKVLESYYKSHEGLRSFPPAARKTFNQQWREKMGYR